MEYRLSYVLYFQYEYRAFLIAFFLSNGHIDLPGSIWKIELFLPLVQHLFHLKGF